MTHLAIHWGNRLEGLAQGLFDHLYGVEWPAPMMPRCIVTNSPVMQAWLRHYFVYEWPQRHGHVLANCDFHLLYPFVNDWMDRLLVVPQSDVKPHRREPRHHPYAIACLQWRIYRLLEDGLADGASFTPIKAYLGDTPSPRRRFQLAGRLATLFDDYQVYRCNVLERWEKGAEPGNWQAETWRRLVKDQPDSYAALFRAMRNANGDRLRERFGTAYRQVAIFGTTAMPAAYVSFLQAALARIVPVDVYVLNPSESDWLQDVSARVAIKVKEQLLLEDHPLKDDPLMLPEKGHPLLCSLGQGLQEHLHILEEQSGGVNDTPFKQPGDDTMLADLQARMFRRDIESVASRGADDSIQVHICHSSRREVEVLHDHLLKWLTEDKLQPYQAQVLVTDMETYAPLIDAVFGSRAQTIPYAVDGRASAADSVVLSAFRAILAIVSSRFTATSILDLLRGEAVFNAFALSTTELDGIEHMVSKSGIRWGLDAEHRKQVTEVPMESHMTWEFGLDRLLTGYALGSPELEAEPWPLDLAEGTAATTLGKLAHFVGELKRFREKLLKGPRPMHEWHGLLAELIDTFLVSTSTTCREVAQIRRAVNDLQPLAGNTGMVERHVPFEVVVSHLEGALGASMSGDSLTANAVVFCRLRPMNSRPAEVVCVLGLKDGVFPRNDNRPTFDLLAKTRQRGDRSVRRDDREAFLEAIVNARRRLFLSYVGRTDSGNVITPPSIVLQELRDYLAITYGLRETKCADGSRLLPFEILHHLQAVHRDYFTGGTLFSYSTANLLAAKQLVKTKAGNPSEEGATAPRIAAPKMPGAFDLETLQRFFENPARYYYRDVLGVNLTLAGPEGGSDEEPFTTNTLEKYLLTTSILDVLKEDHFGTETLDVPALIGRMKADGRVPLGAVGEEMVQELVDTTNLWLDSTPDAGPAGAVMIRTILRQSANTTPVPSDLALDTQAQFSVMLRGACKVLDLNGQPIQVMARPADIKVKDRIRAWIAHLFACATISNAVHTVIIGARDSESYGPLSVDDAKKALVELIELFIEGHAQPLPFAPESSYAYRVALKGNGASQDPAQAALWAAAGAWGYRDSYARDECKDAWLFHAFGEDGPMATKRAGRFAQAAVTFFKRLPVTDASPEAGDDEAEEEE